MKTGKKLGIGKKTKEWSNAREYLKHEFDKLGITYCEANFINCTGTLFLGFAHVLRRNKFGKWDTEIREANLYDVARLCSNCHRFLDVILGEFRGGKELRRIIDNRKGKVSLFKDLK